MTSVDVIAELAISRFKVGGMRVRGIPLTLALLFTEVYHATEKGECRVDVNLGLRGSVGSKYSGVRYR